MRSFDATTLDRLDAGEVDYLDGVTFVLPTGVANMWLGGRGEFEWTDETIGTQTFYGGGSLLSMEVPGNSLANESLQVTLRLNETYMVEGSDVPVNVWDDGSSPTYSIDDESWQGSEVILSCFWRDVDGSILGREQIERLELDSNLLETDENGRTTRVATLERPDIIQRDIEGKTDNAEFQSFIDADDLGYEHTLETATQQINWGRIQDSTASS